ncbi:MAG: hypothetical protein B7Z29_10845 [Hyphomicrobium sp. 12-62-95]|nr:MAG: hypothetical protein B7Z29_10845 [Hyphomicrobium sp. 12-62-95]
MMRHSTNPSMVLSAVWTFTLLASTSVYAGQAGVASAVKNEARGTQAGVLAPGSKIYEQEVVSTGDASMAQLLFLDEPTLSIGPRAKVKLDKLVYDPAANAGDVAISTTKGALRFITGSQNPVNYKIRTPVATTGVRGTVIDLYPDETGPSVFQVQEGIANIMVGGQSYPVSAGQQLTVSPDGSVTGPGTPDGKIRTVASSVPYPLYGNHFGNLVDLRIGGDRTEDQVDQLESLERYEKPSIDECCLDGQPGDQ